MNRKAWYRAFILVLALACLCSGAVGAQAAAKKVKKIKLPAVAVVVKGKKISLEAKITPSGVKPKITWATTNKKVAKVSAKGVVTGVKLGEATVTATAGGKQAKCVVRVVKKVGFYKTGGKTYYCDPSTGELAKGAKTIEGKKYYFDPETGAQQVGLVKLSNGRTYNYLKAGGYSKGLTTIKKKTYYFHKTKGYMLTGLRTISGKKYYFQPDTGEMAKGLVTIKNELYYFDRTTGQQKTGMFKVSGTTYNFLKAGGVSKGFTKLDGNNYYFDSADGHMVIGFFTVDGKTYYAKGTGIIQTGFHVLNNKKYFFDLTTGEQLTGVIKIETGKTYNFLKAGDVSKGLTTVGSVTYYFDESSGAMHTGSCIINEKRYYFDPTTGAQRTGIITLENGNTYNYLKEGDVSKGLTKVNGKTYYFNEKNGVMRYGDRLLNNKRYYFELTTGEMVTGVRPCRGTDGKDYLFFYDPNQATGLRKGLQEYQGNRYFFNEKGDFAMSGYLSVGKDLYFFDPDNECKAKQNATWSYKGLVTMKANANGVITPTGSSTRGKVLQWALTHLGYSYGTGSNQYTCSSFTAAAYAYAGKNYLSNIVSGAQVQALMALQYCPKLVNSASITSLEPGDLIFWDNEDTGCDADCKSRFTYNGTAYHIHHVGIYLGDGEVVEAADETLGTLVQKLPEDDPGHFFVVFGAALLASDIPDSPDVSYDKYFVNPNAFESADFFDAQLEQLMLDAQEVEKTGSQVTLADEEAAAGLAETPQTDLDLQEGEPAYEAPGEAELDLPIFEAEPVPEELEDQDALEVVVLE